MSYFYKKFKMIRRKTDQNIQKIVTFIQMFLITYNKNQIIFVIFAPKFHKNQVSYVVICQI